ncbi:hypothetical protein [Polluticaenibacter yanchengensis]|uniref:DUF695 domain-containing protein n=1 Tax=Polluticaenibacter yanchengensis TaxID=3014562 RepID=A0ABT4UQ99_9BACT|nr:hypothetical protein [Chitinophagaceae bacterium LY-5]
MSYTLNQIKFELINLIKARNEINWEFAEFQIDFPPFINRGFNFSQFVKDENDNNIRLIALSDALKKNIYGFIYIFNQESLYNQIRFKAQKNDLWNSTIEVFFNKEVDDNFQMNIPLSKKDSYLPWWKNVEETKDLI